MAQKIHKTQMNKESSRQLWSLIINVRTVSSGRPGVGRRARHRDRRLQVHAGVEPGEDDARVPGAHDRLPAAPLERQPQGDAGAAVLATRGKFISEVIMAILNLYMH